MDCPSRHFPSIPEAAWARNANDQNPWTTAQGENRSERLKKLAKFDVDEPFWTSGGENTWSDGDEYGSIWLGIFDTGLDGGWEWGSWWWEAETRFREILCYYSELTHANHVSDDGGSLNSICSHSYGPSSQYCNIIGSYQVRPDKAGPSHNSYMLDWIQGKAVASDAI